jgi:hypothetical protein
MKLPWPQKRRTWFAIVAGVFLLSAIVISIVVWSVFRNHGPAQQSDLLVFERFDADGDKQLDSQERRAAREFLKGQEGQRLRRESERGRPGRPPGPPPQRPGGPNQRPGGPHSPEQPTSPGPKIAKSDVQPVTGGFYDTTSFRTIFLDFENDDWESELEDFHGTDIDVPAMMTVDGKQYSGVGVHFRGMSSYMMVQRGQKRSLNLSVDYQNDKQRIHGYKTLNLLNSHEDDSMMSTVLYSSIARNYIPTPKANFVRVVINGEYWGVYTNVQQFDKTFLKENFDSTKGARWKVSGSPQGGGGLEYLGDDTEAYRSHYEMKSGTEKDWNALIQFAKVLNQSPIDKLETQLEPLVDLDGLLNFLALEIALINCDGYWLRASDYSIVLDEHQKLHFIPHDMNEAFRRPMGPGMAGGPGGWFNWSAIPSVTGIELDPLVATNDRSKPLRSRILSVPNLKRRYLEKVREIANKSLDWSSLGPQLETCRDVIDAAVKADTRKFVSYEAFQMATASDIVEPATRKDQEHRSGPHLPPLSIREFADLRRQYLLNSTQEVAK